MIKSGVSWLVYGITNHLLHVLSWLQGMMLCCCGNVCQLLSVVIVFLEETPFYEEAFLKFQLYCHLENKQNAH